MVSLIQLESNRFEELQWSNWGHPGVQHRPQIVSTSNRGWIIVQDLRDLAKTGTRPSELGIRSSSTCAIVVKEASDCNRKVLHFLSPELQVHLHKQQITSKELKWSNQSERFHMTPQRLQTVDFWARTNWA
ncbi:hypothetical protein Nepgr_009359 [Nepenthes gracilis]|uniref:Uncharacterized protein n=1 Tax=Nepenthes gracilis TaxID=150966 RepID=A0AAD3SB56_NEPGR|nr:hypothetical protein Nepgr_009359 [Nepenthes gracilis]